MKKLILKVKIFSKKGKLKYLSQVEAATYKQFILLQFTLNLELLFE